jgi:hypothetical protein
VGGTTTISGIPKEFAVVDAAAACPTVEWVPSQLCPSQSHGSSESQENQQCAPKYRVQSGPNTQSLISRPAAIAGRVRPIQIPRGGNS